MIASPPYVYTLASPAGNRTNQNLPKSIAAPKHGLKMQQNKVELTEI